MEWRILRNPPTSVASVKVRITELMRIIKENDPQVVSGQKEAQKSRPKSGLTTKITLHKKLILFKQAYI